MSQKEKKLNWTEEAALEITPPERLDYLARNGDYYTRLRVARNNNTSSETLAALAHDEEYFIQKSIAINPHTPDEVLAQFVEKKIFLKEVAGNPNASRTTLERILDSKPDPDAKGLKKLIRITENDIAEIFTIALKHPNLPERIIEDFFARGKLSKNEYHEIKAQRNTLQNALKVKDFLPFIYDNYIAISAFTEDQKKNIILASFNSTDIENASVLEKSILSYMKERQKQKICLSTETFTADDILNASIIRVDNLPAVFNGSKSTIVLTIREIEEKKKINYFT